MSTNEHNPCYGKLFPSVLEVEADKLISGKAFAYRLIRVGGTFVSRRTVTVRTDEWDGCVTCSEFENCYNLSMARLALETTVAGI